MSTSELLVADTSFVGQHWRVVTRPELATSWPQDVIRRIEVAVVAVSVVTIAEERVGHRLARWGERRCEQAELWLRQFVHLPVNRPVAEAWARQKRADIDRVGPSAQTTYGLRPQALCEVCQS